MSYTMMHDQDRSRIESLLRSLTSGIQDKRGGIEQIAWAGFGFVNSLSIALIYEIAAFGSFAQCVVYGSVFQIIFTNAVGNPVALNRKHSSGDDVFVPMVVSFAILLVAISVPCVYLVSDQLITVDGNMLSNYVVYIVLQTSWRRVMMLENKYIVSAGIATTCAVISPFVVSLISQFSGNDIEILVFLYSSIALSVMLGFLLRVWGKLKKLKFDTVCSVAKLARSMFTIGCIGWLLQNCHYIFVERGFGVVDLGIYRIVMLIGMPAFYIASGGLNLKLNARGPNLSEWGSKQVSAISICKTVCVFIYFLISVFAVSSWWQLEYGVFESCFLASALFGVSVFCSTYFEFLAVFIDRKQRVAAVKCGLYGVMASMAFGAIGSKIDHAVMCGVLVWNVGYAVASGFMYLMLTDDKLN